MYYLCAVNKWSLLKILPYRTGSGSSTKNSQNQYFCTVLPVPEYVLWRVEGQLSVRVDRHQDGPRVSIDLRSLESNLKNCHTSTLIQNPMPDSAAHTARWRKMNASLEGKKILVWGPGWFMVNTGFLRRRGSLQWLAYPCLKPELSLGHNKSMRIFVGIEPTTYGSRICYSTTTLLLPWCSARKKL